MPSVIWGTLDVLSPVPGAHLPVKASRFHPQFMAFWLFRHGTRLGTASSPAFRLSGTVSLLHQLPGLPAIVCLGLSANPLRRFGTGGHSPLPFGQPVPALRLGTASFLATSSGASARNGVLTVRRQSLPPMLAKTANAECMPADTASTEPLASMLTKAAATWNASRIAVIV